jgi:hypothetical protein
MRRLLVVVILSTAALVGTAGCGSGNGAGSGDGGQPVAIGSAPQKSAVALWNAFGNRLGKRDYAGLCALFTLSGAAGFVARLHASTCEGAAISLAADWSDEALQKLVASVGPPHTSDVKASSASMSSCGFGSMDMVRLDGGWLINEYHGEPGYC